MKFYPLCWGHEGRFIVSWPVENPGVEECLPYRLVSLVMKILCRSWFSFISIRVPALLRKRCMLLFRVVFLMLKKVNRKYWCVSV